MIGAEKMADGRVPLPARSGYISGNLGTFLGRKSSRGRVYRYIQHAHFIAIVGFGKERRILFGPWFTGPVPADSR